MTATACFAIGLGLVDWEEDGPADLDLVDGPEEDGQLGLVDSGEDGPVVEEDRLDPDPVMEEGVMEDGPEGLVDPTGVMVVGSD